MALNNLDLCDTQLEWIVKKPVFVTWNDDFEGPKRLGMLSPLNATSSFTIHIGWNPTEKHALIALKLPISVRSARKARDMFLIVSATDASLRSGPASKLADATALESDIKSCLGSADGADPMLFCVSFRMDGCSDVIMPKAKREKVVLGQPKELMLDLKSLSEAQSFDAYFRFDTYAQRDLHQIFADLSAFKTPCLNLDRMYSGRGGGINLWYDQGLRSCDLEGVQESDGPGNEERDEGQTTVEYPAVYKSVEQLQGPCTPPPPPYSREDTIASPSHDGPLVLVSCSDIDRSHTPSTHSVVSSRVPIPETPLQKASFEAQAWIEAILNYRSPSLKIQDQSPSRKRRAGSLPPCEWSPRPTAFARVAGIYPMPVSHDRRADSLPPCELPQHHSAHNAGTPPSAPSYHSSPETASPSRNAELSISHDKEPSPATITTPQNRENIIEEMTQWLYEAWMLHPTAHHDLRTSLLSWGSATSKTTSSKARAECSMRLSFAMASTNHNNIPTTTTTINLNTAAQAEDQVREVVRWMNDARLGTDLRLMRNLADLAGRAMDLVEIGEVDGGRDGLIRMYLMVKARCIVEACCQ